MTKKTHLITNYKSCVRVFLYFIWKKKSWINLFATQMTKIWNMLHNLRHHLDFFFFLFQQLHTQIVWTLLYQQWLTTNPATFFTDCRFSISKTVKLLGGIWPFVGFLCQHTSYKFIVFAWEETDWEWAWVTLKLCNMIIVISISLLIRVQWFIQGVLLQHTVTDFQQFPHAATFKISPWLEELCI